MHTVKPPLKNAGDLQKEPDGKFLVTAHVILTIYSKNGILLLPK